VSKTTGIRKRHGRSCGSHNGGVCNCKPTYEAGVFSKRDRRKIRRSFPTLAAARSWRADAAGAVRRGTMRAPTSTTIREAWDAWLVGVNEGTIRKQGGETYKPSAVRSYEIAMRAPWHRPTCAKRRAHECSCGTVAERVGRHAQYCATRRTHGCDCDERSLLEELGARKISDLTRLELQDLVDEFVAAGMDPSTLRNKLMPLRAIYRRAVSRGELAVNPTAGLELPAVRGRRDRIADPAEAAQLLKAVPDGDRALWATALYAGLRRGELMALRWEDVDLAAGRIRVERSWDVQEGAIETKSRAGERTVPIAPLLRDYLDEHKLRTGRDSGLVFGRSADLPFSIGPAQGRADSAWKRASLKRLTLHEARHTFASLMIAAGVNAKALSTYMGHSSITITLDRYGHLFPGNEDEAAGLLDAYLKRAKGAASAS
jgi:integrase